ncbi:hypothetical protein EBL_c12970 [Shimwellia blattae DSM 4481 = NBRC 105725]|uniref:Uncharacterized protein n=1 Tax=Shimwellia blattae (strain ATCC 29907 / DSM 4481 / JCM 1650 / NBRC 105725 / CDC 9005-74) TaxID=630626 RepID=I2B796_SHIBC|nr:hypothetical protein EBL_c12970 [Shimwellia blattae DSM 4481 = NBRC 105725]
MFDSEHKRAFYENKMVNKLRVLQICGRYLTLCVLFHSIRRRVSLSSRSKRKVNFRLSVTE